ncbi:TetR/AcrR family transcriptional regulator [Jatrophihabitans sp.]|uniref:TetR/AcrR family transcriptional regulator n=1 Tax=Jatrophihabitans sp. TaxID=1932789 RepID=UPI0030C6DE89|nr:TetR family transcriptional regulator [Jatrophihabitans sp.]
MGHHGWNGNPPPSEEEARRRIVAAAADCIEQFGAAKTTLSDVANELGVTRQTVYRYYANLGELFGAVAQDRVEDFVDRMAAHLSGFTSAADVAIESVVWAVRTIPQERFVGALLGAGESDAFSRGVTSSLALALGSGILRRVGVEWSQVGVADSELEGLAELLMRLFVSFLQYPADPPRSDDELRQLVGRWLGPALGGGVHVA